MITLAFFDDRSSLAIYENAVELPSTIDQIARDCGQGVGGCVLIFPNEPNGRCFTIVPKDPTKLEAWRKATQRDCKTWNDNLP